VSNWLCLFPDWIPIPAGVLPQLRGQWVYEACQDSEFYLSLSTMFGG
jgi:hypothetical protein